MKGYHLSMEGIRKRYLFLSKKVYKRVRGLDLEAEPPLQNFFVEYKYHSTRDDPQC